MDFAKKTAALGFLATGYYYAFTRFENENLDSFPFFYRVLQTSIVMNLLSLGNLARNPTVTGSVGWFLSMFLFYGTMTYGTFTDNPAFESIRNEPIYQEMDKFYRGTIVTSLHFYFANEMKEYVGAIYSKWFNLSKRVAEESETSQSRAGYQKLFGSTVNETQYGTRCGGHEKE